MRHIPCAHFVLSEKGGGYTMERQKCQHILVVQLRFYLIAILLLGGAFLQPASAAIITRPFGFGIPIGDADGFGFVVPVEPGGSLPEVPFDNSESDDGFMDRTFLGSQTFNFVNFVGHQPPFKPFEDPTNTYAWIGNEVLQAAMAVNYGSVDTPGANLSVNGVDVLTFPTTGPLGTACLALPVPPCLGQVDITVALGGLLWGDTFAFPIVFTSGPQDPFAIDSFIVSVSGVQYFARTPEPGTLLLLGSGLVGLAVGERKRSAHRRKEQ
jgi:hypothetical protein